MLRRIIAWLSERNLPSWTAPIALLGVALLAYGLLIPWLGFYWDDYPLSWIYAHFGSDGLRDYFSTNRPFWGWLFQLTMPLFRQPWQWQILGLLCRWLSAVMLWLLLRAVWSRHPQPALWTSLLFLVYPGFQQQHVPIIYSHLFLVLSFFFGSLYLNIKFIRKRRFAWLGHTAALGLSLYHLLALEYFFLLELLRPLLVWVSLDGQELSRRQRLRTTALSWLPYLAVFAAVGVWRAFFFQFQTENYQIVFFQQLREDASAAILALLSGMADSLWVTVVAAWGLLIRLPETISAGPRAIAFSLGATGLCAVAFATFLLFYRRNLPAQDGRGWGLSALALGLVALLVAGGPSWLTGVLPRLAFSLDRFTLPFMLGASLLLSAALGALPAPPWLKWTLAGVLVSLAVGMHVRVSDNYRQDGEFQQRFFWQLAWRVPGLREGTTLLVNDLPLTYYSDNSLTAPLNWFWAPDNTSRQMAYLLYYPGQRLGRSLASLNAGVPIQVDYLAATFEGSTSQVVAVYYNPPACLRVLEPDLDSENKMLPEVMQQTALLSSAEWIAPDGIPVGERLPADLYGAEPAHGWCYYFEMADLARQLGDWARVADLGDRAFSSGDYPNDPAERLVFIEGYAYMGNWQRARQLTIESQLVTPLMTPVLCRLWQRVDAQTALNPLRDDTISTVLAELGCFEGYLP